MRVGCAVAAAGLVLGLGVASATLAAPYVPANDDVVVQRLPTRIGAEDRARQQRLRGEPRNVALALAEARDAMQRARRSGDVRELGRAQAALAPWWATATPPAEVRLLRASVLQSQHQFERALQDLDVLVADAPQADSASADHQAIHRQALLMRSAVHQVRGALKAATDDCESLLRDAGGEAGIELTARACIADLMSLRGQTQAADDTMRALQRQAPQHPWVALVAAAIAQRQGDVATTEAMLRRAFAASPDAYTLAALADVYLESGRPAQALAVALHPSAADSDALVLRRAVARKRVAASSTSAAAAASVGAQHDARAMRERLALARARGERHAREEALFALDVDGDAANAWRHAQANWAEQKEPIDALLLVRAALAAGQRAAAEAFVAERKAAGWHDHRLLLALQERS